MASIRSSGILIRPVWHFFEEELGICGEAVGAKAF
jgi:hypothetical protein